MNNQQQLTYNYIINNVILYTTTSRAEYLYIFSYMRNLPKEIKKKYRPRIVLGSLPVGAIIKSYHSCGELIKRLDMTIKLTKDIPDDKTRDRVILTAYFNGVIKDV